MDAETHWLWSWLATAGLALITLVTRAFFLIPKEPLPMPQWLSRGLQYAPLAALTAVVAPEIFMTDGHFLTTWQDARLPAAACATLYFVLRRDILGTIAVGMLVYLPLHIGGGW